MIIGGNRVVQHQTNSAQGRQRVSRRDKVKELKEKRVELLERVEPPAARTDSARREFAFAYASGHERGW